MKNIPQKTYIQQKCNFIWQRKQTENIVSAFIQTYLSRSYSKQVTFRLKVYFLAGVRDLCYLICCQTLLVIFVKKFKSITQTVNFINPKLLVTQLNHTLLQYIYFNWFTRISSSNNIYYKYFTKGDSGTQYFLSCNNTALLSQTQKTAKTANRNILEF